MGARKARRAKVLAIVNNKGGCGKTCAAQNLAAALRLQGLNVLAVDTDGQANLTACFGYRAPQEGQQLYRAMKGQEQPPQPLSVLLPDEEAGALDLLPAVEDFAALNVELANDHRRAERLGDIIEPLRSRYDCILIDTPPAADLLTINAMYAADAVIIATQPQPLAAEGLLKVRDRLQVIADNRGRDIPYFVIVNQYDRRKNLHRLTVEALKDAGLDICPVMVRECVALGEATAAGRDIYRYAPRSSGAEDFRRMAREVRKWGF